MIRGRLAPFATALLCLSPALSGAQSATDVAPAPLPVSTPPLSASMTIPPAPSVAPATAPVASGPVAGANAVALRAVTAPAPAPRVPRGNTSDNRALMIVGGVGLLVGAVIGGDAGTLVMLGSAGVGLWGLYRFLN
jgi:hypothetical protein